MVRDGSLAQFRLQLRQDKCIARLLELAKITETVPKKKIKKTRKTTKREAVAEKKQPAKRKTTTRKKPDK